MKLLDADIDINVWQFLVKVNYGNDARIQFRYPTLGNPTYEAELQDCGYGWTLKAGSAAEMLALAMEKLVFAK